MKKNQLALKENNFPVNVGERSLLTTKNILEKEDAKYWYDKGFEKEKSNTEFAGYCYDKAIFYDELHWQAHLRFAYCLSKDKLNKEIAISFEKALAILLSNEVFTAWANLIQNLNLEKEEIEDLIQLFSNSSNESEIIISGHLFCLAEKWEEALEKYEGIKTFTFKNEKFFFLKGLALYHLQKHNDAIKSFDFSIEMNPEFSLSWFFKGSANEALGENIKAQNNYNRAIEINPNFLYFDSPVKIKHDITSNDLEILKIIVLIDKGFLINIISTFYPLSESIINNQNRIWNWGSYDDVLDSRRGISANINLFWTANFINEHRDKLDWSILSSNESIPWSESIIEQYERQLSWGFIYKTKLWGLSFNKSLPWSEKLIEKYKDKWNWRILSLNRSLPWTADLIERYKDRWSWSWDNLDIVERDYWDNYFFVGSFHNYYGWSGISENTAIPWTESIIKKYYIKWDWSRLSSNESLPWSFELIKEYSEKWDWEFLSQNEALPWSIELIKEYSKKWYWEGLYNNESLPWTMDFIEEFINQLEKPHINRWGNASKTSLFSFFYNSSWNKGFPWAEELIAKYEEEWDWESLSRNNALPWSEELIVKYGEKWDWEGLSKNSALPWSEELIAKYEDKWDFSTLSENKGIFWSFNLLEKYKDKLKWYNFGEWYGNLKWTNYIIKKFSDKISWLNLSQEVSAEWSIKLLEEYKENWDWEMLSNNRGLFSSVFKNLPENIIEELIIYVQENQ